MALGFRKFFEGIRLLTNSTSKSTIIGEVEVLDTGVMLYHNGTTNSQVVTSSHSATLTNKTIAATSNTITDLANANISNSAAIVESKLVLNHPSNELFGSLSTIVTLSGVPAGSTTLGSFSGTVIPDNQNVKEAIQTLETYVENGGVNDLPHLKVNIIPDTGKTLTLGSQALPFDTSYVTNSSVSSQLSNTLIVNQLATFLGQAYSEQQGSASISSPSNTAICNWNLGNSIELDLGAASGDVTLTMSNPKSGASYLIKVIQRGTSRNLTLSPTVRWRNGVTPDLSTDNPLALSNTVDFLSLYYDGTEYFCSIGRDY